MNKKIKVILYIIVLLILAFSVYMCLKLNNIYEEGFVSGHCPTTIIKRNNQILLYDPKMVKIPGVNPIVLDSLKDYEKFIKWQRASKIRCPLLHLEQVYDTQNNAQYEIRNSFMSNEPMSPLNHDLPNLNNKSNCMKTLRFLCPGSQKRGWRSKERGAPQRYRRGCSNGCRVTSPGKPKRYRLSRMHRLLQRRRKANRFYPETGAASHRLHPTVS